MLEQQDYCCYICREPFDLSILGSYHVDHDHGCCPPVGKKGSYKTCGKCVRSLLCKNCNLALGFAKEEISRLEAMVAYIKLNPRYRQD